MASVILGGGASPSSPAAQTELRSDQEEPDSDRPPDSAQLVRPPSPADSEAVFITVRSEEPRLDEKVEKNESKNVVADVKAEGDGDKVCRICHVSPDLDGGTPERSELIQIGCGCKDDLGTAHRHCAEAWFRVKGNRYCEICGLNAKNVKGEDDSRFMDAWYDRRTAANGNIMNPSERTSCWRGQPFCNFLMACLVIAFILPWFLRVKMF